MSEWINCSEKLPLLQEPVLLYQTWPKGTMFNCRADPLKSTHIKLGGLCYNGGFISYDNQHGESLKHVSHWMPLPSKPKNDND